MTLLKVEHLKKEYQSKFKNNTVVALADVSFEVEKGEFIAIMGESGSGKSTLLNCIATLDQPTAGTISLNNQNFKHLSDKQLAAFRRDHLGFVFQDFNLLDTMSVADNIYLPLILAKNTNNKEQKLSNLAKQLGLQDLLNKYPYELSGGQKQRVAIGRALITNPEILLADEPTGALDSKNSADILSIFEQYNQQNQTILMVTHSALAASHAQRVLFIKDGKVFHQTYRGNKTEQEMLLTISDAMTNLLGGLIKMLYWKLAWQSIVKNRLEYLPFMLAGSAAVALNMVIQLLIYSKGVKKLAANVSVIEMLTFSQIVIAIFSIIFLLYTYSFLSKRKQSEFGLFSILGLQKVDLIKISWRQQFISFLAVTFLASLLVLCSVKY